jgi:hypothetical protein
MRLLPFRITQGIVVLPSCFMASNRCRPQTKTNSVFVFPHPRSRLTNLTVIGLWRPNDAMDTASSFDMPEFNARVYLGL